MNVTKTIFTRCQIFQNVPISISALPRSPIGYSWFGEEKSNGRGRKEKRNGKGEGRGRGSKRGGRGRKGREHF